MRRFLAVAMLGVVLVSTSGAALAGKDLDAVKARGTLICGVAAGGIAGFMMVDSQGKWTGLDVDICRATAAAIFGDSEKVKYAPLSGQTRFTALQSGEVDVLSNNSTWTLTRDSALGLDFVGVTYYDGQGFMVPKKLGVKSAKEMNGASICVPSGSTTELNVADYFRAMKMIFKPVIFEDADQIRGAFFSGRCQAYTTDASGLASVRNKEAGNPDDHVILPDLISKEPLGPAVRRGDDEFYAIVKWVVFALIEAEEYGITQANVDQMKSSTDPVVQRILGTSEDTGKLLGLDKDWAYRAIKATGNYGEIFENNVGPKSALKLPRGMNNLWNKGGIMYAPPVR